MTPPCPQPLGGLLLKVWRRTSCPSVLPDIPSSVMLGVAACDGVTLLLPSPQGRRWDPKTSPVSRLGTRCMGAPALLRQCHLLGTRPPAQPGTPLEARDPAHPPRVTPMPIGASSPADTHRPLLLVTGMLWTVRSLKQDPVSTCSSTELSTKAWRSGAGEGLQRDAASTGLQSHRADPWQHPREKEPRGGLGSLRITLLLQFLNGLPPLRPLVIGGQQE